MNLGIIVSGRPRLNIVKQNDISIVCIHEKKKGFPHLLNVFVPLNTHFVYV